jgi:hypothetical protein
LLLIVCKQINLITTPDVTFQRLGFEGLSK